MLIELPDTKPKAALVLYLSLARPSLAKLTLVSATVYKDGEEGASISLVLVIIGGVFLPPSS